MVTLQIFLAICLALPCSAENDITPSIENELQFQGMYAKISCFSNRNSDEILPIGIFGHQ